MNGFIHFADPALGTSLSFPGLGLELSLNREAVFIGPLTIYWYGIIVVTGIALGIWYAVWRAGQFGIDRDRITDVILYSVLAAIVGARLYYVAFSWDYYSAHPEEIIAVWKGGIAFYGGVSARCSVQPSSAAAGSFRWCAAPMLRSAACCLGSRSAAGAILSTSRRLAGILKAHGGWSAPQLTVTFTFTLICCPDFPPSRCFRCRTSRFILPFFMSPPGRCWGSSFWSGTPSAGVSPVS